jgi:hypothetical protein
MQEQIQNRISEFLKSDPVYYQMTEKDPVSYQMIDEIWDHYKNHSDNLNNPWIDQIFETHIRNPEHLVLCYIKGADSVYVMLHSKILLERLRIHEISEYCRDHGKIDYEDYLLLTSYRKSLPLWRFKMDEPKFRHKMSELFSKKGVSRNNLLVVCYLI